MPSHKSVEFSAHSLLEVSGQELLMEEMSLEEVLDDREIHPCSDNIVSQSGNHKWEPSGLWCSLCTRMTFHGGTQWPRNSSDLTLSGLAAEWRGPSQADWRPDTSSHSGPGFHSAWRAGGALELLKWEKSLAQLAKRDEDAILMWGGV